MIRCFSFVSHVLSQLGKRLFEVRIAVLGLAYKKNINDSWESPPRGSLEIVKWLMALHAIVWEEPVRWWWRSCRVWVLEKEEQQML